MQFLKDFGDYVCSFLFILRWIDRRTHSFKKSRKGVRAVLLGVIHDRLYMAVPMIPGVSQLRQVMVFQPTSKGMPLPRQLQLDFEIRIE